MSDTTEFLSFYRTLLQITGTRPLQKCKSRGPSPKLIQLHKTNTQPPSPGRPCETHLPRTTSCKLSMGKNTGNGRLLSIVVVNQSGSYGLETLVPPRTLRRLGRPLPPSVACSLAPRGANGLAPLGANGGSSVVRRSNSYPPRNF
jgi:hypothetical protein